MAAASFSLYRALVPAGGVTAALSASLLSPTSRDLVVVRHNYVEIYSISEGDAAETAAATAASASASSGSGLSDRAILQRRYEQHVYGTVESICSVRLAGWTRDALLFASPHSKLSLCAWDVGTAELVTLCIWSQDEDVVSAAAVAQAKSAALMADQAHAQYLAQQAQQALQPSPLMHLAKSFMAPMLRVDPTGRCAALVTYDSFLNIFDLTQAALQLHHQQQQQQQQHYARGDESKEGLSSPPCQSGVATSSTGAHYFHSTASASSALSSLAGVGVLPTLSAPKTYSLASLGLGSITDLQFLHGLEDPTLLILHEKQRTWAGRYATTALGSQEVTVLTFDPRKQAFSIMGGASGVSHDTRSIYPIPMPLGGALLFSLNAIWHWSTHNAFDYALSLNVLLGPETTLTSAKSARIEPAAFVLTLDQAYACFLATCTDRVTMFLATKHGEAFLLHVLPAGGSVKSMQLDPIGHVAVPQGCVRMIAPGGGSNTSASFDAPYSSGVVQAALSQPGQFVFAYSRMGPSVLLEYRKPSEEERREMEQEAREEEAILAEEQRLKTNAADAAARIAAAASAVKMELSSAATTASGIPSLGAQLDAAATVAPSAAASQPASQSSSSTNAHDEASDQPAAKRSRIDDLYDEAYELGGDELMDVFGFAAAPSSAAGAGSSATGAGALQLQQGTGVGGGGLASAGVTDKSQPDAFMSAAVPSSNSTITAPTSADGTLLDAETLEALEAEAGALRVAAAKEDVRRAALERAIRVTRHELRFFLRDRLAASVSSPGQALALGTVLPPEEDQRLEAEEREQAAAAGDKPSASSSSGPSGATTRELPKNAPDEEVRAAEAADIQELQELQKRWRAKERRGRVLELVQLSGHEDSGSLVLSQEGVVPDVIATLPLEQRVTGCWTLRHASLPSKGKKQQVVDDTHEFILVSTADSTLVFRAGEQIQQLLEPDAAVNAAFDEFLQQQATIPAGAVLLPWVQAKNTPEGQQGTGAYASLMAEVRARLEQSAKEAHTHPFDIKHRTVTAGPLRLSASADSGGSALVQVTTSAVRLIVDGKLHSSHSAAGEIVSAHVVGDRVVGRLRGADDEADLFVFQGDSVVAVPSPSSAPLTAVSLFADSSRLRALAQYNPINAGMDVNGGDGIAKLAPSSVAQAQSAPVPMDEFDDLERVFGTSNNAATVAPVIPAASTAAAAAAPPDHYSVLAAGATVEIRSLKAGHGGDELIYRIPRFAVGKHVLQHSMGDGGELPSSFDSSDDKSDSLSLYLPDSALPRVVDLFLGVVSDSSDAMPVMMSFLENGDFLAYQSFVAVVLGNGGGQVQELRWRRLAAPSIARPFLSQTNSMLVSSTSEQAAVDVNKAYRDAFGLARGSREWSWNSGQPSRFQLFTHLACSDAPDARRTGLLISGTKPLFVSAERGALRFHPFVVDWRARNSDDAVPSASSGEHGSVSVLGAEQRLEAEEDVEGEEAAAVDGRKKEGLICAAAFDFAERDAMGNKLTARGLLFFDAQGNLHISKLQPSQRLPSHPLYVPPRKLLARGLASPLVSALSSHSTLSSSIAPSPALMDYDSSFLLRRTVHLGCTPLFVARHVPTSTTAVVVSRRVRVPSKELELERSPPVYGQRYEVLLFHSRSWELIGRHADFEPHEMILTCCAVAMHKQVYIALGTSVYQGEDLPCRGRIVLIDLYHALAPAPAGGDDDEQVALLKIKVYSQAEKLPVSVLAPMAPNMLVAAEGSRIILYSHTGSRLLGRAFIDCDLWVTSLSTLHSFILYGDVSRGAHLLYYDSTLQTLVQLGASAEKFHVTATEFLVDGKQVSLVAADEQANLHMLKFTPNTTTHYSGARGAHWPTPENTHVLHRPASSQGMAANPYTSTSMLGGLGYQLTLKNDFHVGEKVGHMIKLRLRNRLAMTTAGGVGGGAPGAKTLQSLLLMATYSGGLAHLLPVEQALFRRLSSLTAYMSSCCPSLGGLHPLGYRLFKSYRAGGTYHPTLAKKVLDLSVLATFPDLDVDTQWRLSTVIGSTPAQIIDTLKRILWATQMH